MPKSLVGLLDTNILIDYFRGSQSIKEWLVSQGNFGIPGFVFLELLQGARSLEEQNSIRRHFKGVPILWPEPQTCEWAVNTYIKYHLSHGIGIMDALIASVAFQENIPLYTMNTKHFEMIDEIEMKVPE